jgi:uncharacterized protein
MPAGKPAGIRCLHLNKDHSCNIFYSASRPKVCGGFQAEYIICGNSRTEAITILAQLEGIDINTDDIL